MACQMRSDWIETIHDGTFVGDWFKLGIVLPSALVLLFLWGSGVWMWLYPFLGRRRVRRHKAELAATALRKWRA